MFLIPSSLVLAPHSLPHRAFVDLINAASLTLGCLSPFALTELPCPVCFSLFLIILRLFLIVSDIATILFIPFTLYSLVANTHSPLFENPQALLDSDCFPFLQDFISSLYFILSLPLVLILHNFFFPSLVYSTSFVAFLQSAPAFNPRFLSMHGSSPSFMSTRVSNLRGKDASILCTSFYFRISFLFADC